MRAALACVLAAALAAQDGVHTVEHQAEAALARGDASAAADLYLSLARATPSERKWAVAAADALGRAGRFNDALDFLEGARRAQPAAAELTTLLAKTYMLKAEAQVRENRRDRFVVFDYEQAARLAEEAVAAQPSLRDAHLILAEASYAIGDPERALAAAQDAAARFPDHPGGHTLVAKVMLDRFAAAKQRINDEQPKGKALEAIAKEAEAARVATMDALKAATAADAERAFPHKLLGDLHAWSGKTALALDSYEQALARDPQFAVPHAWLVANTKPLDRAAMFRRALEAYGKRPGADLRRAATLAWHIAYAQFEGRKWKEARAGFQAAIQANPDYTNSLYYIWLASYWLGEHAVAEQQAAAFALQLPVGFADTLRAASDRDQVLPIVTFLAARAFKEKRLAQSCALNHVLALVQDTAEAWNNYAFMCRDTGQFDASLTAYRNALAKEPDSPQLLNDTAVILHYHQPSPEHLAEAKAMYERAIQLAERQIAAGKLKGPDLARVQQALQDARGNLAKM